MTNTGAADVREALDAFRRIVQALRGAGRDGARRAALSSAQVFALQQIAAHPGSSINELAALTFTHQSSVSVVIQRLAAQKLVARMPSAVDRRRRHLIITTKGARVLERLPAALQERLIAAIASLRPADRRALAQTLGKIARLVTPPGSTEHPPMFFEESGKRSDR